MRPARKSSNAIVLAKTGPAAGRRETARRQGRDRTARGQRAAAGLPSTACTHLAWACGRLGGRGDPRFREGRRRGQRPALPPSPSTSSGQAPSAGSGQAPSTSSGQAPSTSSGQAPSTSSGQAPSAGSGQALDTRLVPLLGMRGDESRALVHPLPSFRAVTDCPPPLILSSGRASGRVSKDPADGSAPSIRRYAPTQGEGEEAAGRAAASQPSPWVSA